MQPNVVVAESIGHRARFVWLGLALASTIALLVIPPLVRDAPSAERAEPILIDRSMYRVHRCHESRRARMEAARAEHRARFEAERAIERGAESERRAAERAIERAQRAERRLRRAAERATERATERAAERAAERAERHHLRYTYE